MYSKKFFQFQELVLQNVSTAHLCHLQMVYAVLVMQDGGWVEVEGLCVFLYFVNFLKFTFNH